MSRHYQLVLHTYEDETQVAVHEAFLDEEGNIQAVTEYPVILEGESVKDIKAILAAINYDINKYPVITGTDFVTKQDMEPIMIPYDELDEEGISYEIDSDEDLVDIFKRGY